MATLPLPMQEEKPVSRKSFNPFASAGNVEQDSEWDDSFEAFASGRLQNPKDMTTKFQPTTDLKVNDVLHHQPLGVTLKTRTSVDAASVTTDTNMFVLDTIPEDGSFEDKDMFSTTTDSLKLGACPEANDANVLADTKVHQTPSTLKLCSNSPDPSSSGLGSSAEDDFLSCVSSYSASDKFSSSDDSETQNFDSSVLCCDMPSESTVVKNGKHTDFQDMITEKSKESSVDLAQQTVVQYQDADANVHSNSLKGCSTMITQPHPVIGSGDQENSTTKVFFDSLSESDKSDKSTYSAETAVDKHFSVPPSFNIITSSPGVGLSDSPFESTSIRQQDESPVPFRLFGEFFSASLSRDLDGSLYVSSDSQHYQSCQSHQTSKCSDISPTLHSANSTLCGELSDIPTPAGEASDKDDVCRRANRETTQSYWFEESCAEEDRTATLGDDVHVYSVAPTPKGSYQKNNAELEEDVENQRTVFDDMFFKGPLAQWPTLHRSQSEGTLTSSFDKPLLPSFGSDSCALQEISSAQCGLSPPCLTSFAPSVTPENSSFSVAPCSPSPFSNGLARSPPSMAQAAVSSLANTKPMPQEAQQLTQADDQQNR